jgi:tetratricopeptide (TPR) repeat protein
MNEIENLLAKIDCWLDDLISMGLSYEDAGQYEKAMDIYKKGLEKAEKAKLDISVTMLGLLD